MDVTIRRDNGDLVVEVTAKDANTGDGVDLTIGGAAISVTIEKRSGVNKFFNSGNGLFDFVAEPAFPGPPAPDAMTFVRDGIHEFVLTGAEESIERGFRIRPIITGAIAGLNNTVVFSTTIAVAAAPGDATLANQVLIIADTTQLLLDTIALAAQNTVIDAKTTNLPSDPASETNVDDNETKIDSLATGQAALSSEHTGINDNIDDNEVKIDSIITSLASGIEADVIKWAGSSTIDGVTIEDFGKILMAYTTGRFKINTPLDGDITFFEQDNSTPMFVLHINATERTRL